MKKLAIFVEGYTEVLFLTHLLPEICNAHKIVIQHSKISGGGKSPKRISSVNAVNPLGSEEYFILIYDCMGDKLVAQRIKEEHQSLTQNGFSKIIGVRDVRPDVGMSDIPKLEISLRKYIKTKLIPVEFILSVMEIEAWFLAEHTHFERIDATLNIELIKNSLGFDPSLDDMQLRSNPQIDLNNCYGLVGKTYSKGDPTTASNLDYALVYIDLPTKLPHVQKLINCLDGFLT